MKKAVIIIVSFVLVCLGTYFMFNTEDTHADEQYARSSGRQVLNSKGQFTAFSVYGPDDGDVLLMIHGFSVPSNDWDGQVQFFADAGYKVISYDHYGRGFSSNKDLSFDKDMYIEQIDDLLEGLAIDMPVLLMGHSMGGAIAAEYTVRNPEKVKGLVLNAPMLYPSRGNTVVQLLKLPLIGDFAARIIMKPSMQSRSDQLFAKMPDTSKSGEYSAAFANQMKVVGFESSVLKLFRNGAFDDYSDSFTRLGNVDIPIQMIFGTDDKSVSQQDFAFIRNAVRPDTYEIIENGSHSINLERPDYYNQAVLRFFKKYL